MSVKSTAKLLLMMAGLLVMAVPASAAETLVLTCTVCDHVDAKASGLPPGQMVRLTMTDLKTGQEVAAVPVRVDSSGRFVKEVPVDLHKHPTLQSSVWGSSNGELLVIASHERFVAPCKPLPADAQLAFSGSNTPLLLALGAGLLLAGTFLVRAGGPHGRRRRQRLA
jgi:hypothetical protein